MKPAGLPHSQCDVGAPCSSAQDKEIHSPYSFPLFQQPQWGYSDLHHLFSWHRSKQLKSALGLPTVLPAVCPCLPKNSSWHCCDTCLAGTRDFHWPICGSGLHPQWLKFSTECVGLLYWYISVLYYTLQKLQKLHCYMFETLKGLSGINNI